MRNIVPFILFYEGIEKSTNSTVIVFVHYVCNNYFSLVVTNEYIC